MSEHYKEIGAKFNLEVHEVTPDPSYFMMHIYVTEKEEGAYEKSAQEMAKYIFNNNRIANKIYHGHKRKGLYDFNPVFLEDETE